MILFMLKLIFGIIKKVLDQTRLNIGSEVSKLFNFNPEDITKNEIDYKCRIQ